MGLFMARSKETGYGYLEAVADSQKVPAADKHEGFEKRARRLAFDPPRFEKHLPRRSLPPGQT